MIRVATGLLILCLGASACRGTDQAETCSAAIEHTAELAIAQQANLPEAEALRHEAALSRALTRDLGSHCNDSNEALITCVLDAETAVAANSCWRNHR